MNKTQTERFERFYRGYPHKVSRGAAEKAWEKLDPDDDLTQQMILAVEAQVRYRRECKLAGTWMADWPGAGPWINQKRWLDEIGSTTEQKEKAKAKLCQQCGGEWPCEKHFYDNLRDDWRWEMVKAEWERLGKPRTQAECIEALKREDKLNLLLMVLNKRPGSKGGNLTKMGDL